MKRDFIIKSFTIYRNITCKNLVFSTNIQKEIVIFWNKSVYKMLNLHDFPH